ncbi:tetratricopeptide repeat protein [Streptomyces chartreusis]|uniref:tetratricopeptide repeat protein n=1 Tax=Streptomyces chartreusis TaxID=1969 RepID=UPI0037FE6306
MARGRQSVQELIARRRRAGFVGRGAERAAFRANFDTLPEDERHRFLFHVHGNAGVGKTFLLRELEQVAREYGALTAYVDETSGSVPDVMEAISLQFAAQGTRCKDLDRLLTAHRERRYEAELAAVTAPEAEPPAPSAGSVAVARAGLVGLGMVPAVGAFASVLDPAQLAQGADRLRSGLGARFRSHEDARLVLAPESVLTPVFLDELARAASAAPWTVLFLDTYERTGRFLDGWLHRVMTTDRYGALPDTVVVVTAGQLPRDGVRWGGFGDFMTDLPLLPFTEPEARDLLAGRGVVAEPVVSEVLRLTGGLPVLVSTLAEGRPAGPTDVGDPSATAVDRFLKWESDPVRRSVALACALPRRLDADVFRAVVDRPDAELDELYTWLRALPFVSERGGRVRYHDVVRAPMLRLQRHRSPRTWESRHRALAATFRDWRTQAEAGRGPAELWADGGWRELRLAELYHLLCAGERSAPAGVLGDLVDACEQGESVAGQWARVLVEAGADAESRTVAGWGERLAEALGGAGTVAALELVLRWTGFETGPVFAARVDSVDFGWSGAAGGWPQGTPQTSTQRPGSPAGARRREDARADRSEDARLDRREIAPEDRREIAPEDWSANTREDRGEDARVDRREIAPEDWSANTREDWGANTREDWGEDARVDRREDAPDYLSADDQEEWSAGRDISADHGWSAEPGWSVGSPEPGWSVTLDPGAAARAYRARAMSHDLAGDLVAAVTAMDRALRLAPEDPRSLALRGEYHRALEHPDEALRDLDRALLLHPDDAFALASRGAVRLVREEFDEALADLDRAVRLKPDYPWALVRRARVHRSLGDQDRQLADLELAAAVGPDWAWVRCERGDALRGAGRDEEALADYDHALALEPGYESARASRGASLANLGRHAEALADLDLVLERRPTYAWALTRRAAVHRHLGDDARAAADEELAARLTATDPA